VVDLDQIREVALALPRTQEHLIRGRVKLRVGPIVYAALSRDGTELDVDEMTELVTDAWRMVVPRRVAVARLGP
jgi:hypothetical protein